MAKKNFVVQTGTSIGTANVSALTGDIKTSGNLQVSGTTSLAGNVTVIGNTFGSNIYQNGNQVLDTSTVFQTEVRRQDFFYTTPTIPLNEAHEFEIEIGISFIVYRLSVSRPCKVEIFGSADKTELNPYTFIATQDHLIDDGSTLLSDGSIIQSRQYAIFANLETPAQPKVYAKISNITNDTGPVSISLIYFIGVAGLFS